MHPGMSMARYKLIDWLIERTYLRLSLRGHSVGLEVPWGLLNMFLPLLWVQVLCVGLVLGSCPYLPHYVKCRCKTVDWPAVGNYLFGLIVNKLQKTSVSSKVHWFIDCWCKQVIVCLFHCIEATSIPCRHCQDNNDWCGLKNAIITHDIRSK